MRRLLVGAACGQSVEAGAQGRAIEEAQVGAETEAGLETYGDAVAEVLEFRVDEGEMFEMSVDEWRRIEALDFVPEGDPNVFNGCVNLGD